MEFRKYGSIENTYHKKSLDECYKQGLAGGEWHVSEKIHGANFAIYYDGTDIQYAKRTAILEKDESFYEWQSVAEEDELELKIKNLYKEIGGDIGELRVMGELFGGNYPHKDVEKTKCKMVQKGVLYSPKQHFVAYDILVNGEILPPSEATELLDKAGFVQVDTLFTGSLEECLQYKNDGVSQLYKKYNLPEIENNIMEGVVIKPLNDVRFYGNKARVIYKNKNEKFAEKEKRNKPKKVPKKLTIEERETMDLIEPFISENRLRNIISHIGEIEQSMFGLLQCNLIKDVLSDATSNEEISEKINSLSKGSKKVINKEVGKISVALIKKNFIDIVNGEF